MFFRPCPAAADSPSKPSPLSRTEHEALVDARADHDLGPRGVRVLAHVRQAFLHDAEDLDLLVRREPDVGIDLEIDLELSVGGQELDVAAQRGVERCVSGGGGQCEDREARLLLRRVRRPPRSLAIVSSCGAPVLQHRRMRRDGEEVLRETVVDLARDPRAFLGDGAPELRVADRAPGAGEQQPVGEQPQASPRETDPAASTGVKT